MNEELSAKQINFINIGFNFGFSGITAAGYIDPMIAAFENQKKMLAEIEKSKLEANEKLIQDNRIQLTDLLQELNSHYLATVAFRPIYFLYFIVFYCIGFVFTNNILTHYFAQQMNYVLTFLIFNGAWSILTFFLYTINTINEFVVKYIARNSALFHIIVLIVFLICLSSYLFNLSMLVQSLVLTFIILISSLGLFLFIGTSSMCFLRGQIEQKKAQIMELERLQTEIHTHVWRLLDKIEEEKTAAILGFNRGYFYGLSLNHPSGVKNKQQ